MNKTCILEELETQVPAILMGLKVSQVEALRGLADRFQTTVDWDVISLGGGSGFPTGWATGQIGPLFVGVSPEGEVNS
ncbi:MAG: hypothetical protein HQL69_15490 [Magnetococcales bacterium]|nr:hypothetical protein [Magnetococcales bacterium]